MFPTLVLLAMLKSGFDLGIMNELNFWNNDVLLALDQVDFELVQVFLDVVEALRRSGLSTHFALFVRVEQRNKRVFDICSSELKDIEVFTDVSEVDDLHLLRDVSLSV